MTNVEIGMIVAAALIPIIALVILFPFKKKKKSKTKPDKATAVENKPAEAKPVAEDIPSVTTGITTASLDSSDFLDYLREKSSTVKKPERKEIDFNPGEFDDIFSDKDFGQKRNVKKEKPISQQFQELSPELKALMIAGVLDRKDY